jgi:hypothetical protein
VSQAQGTCSRGYHSYAKQTTVYVLSAKGKRAFVRCDSAPQEEFLHTHPSPGCACMQHTLRFPEVGASTESGVMVAGFTGSVMCDVCVCVCVSSLVVGEIRVVFLASVVCPFFFAGHTMKGFHDERL